MKNPQIENARVFALDAIRDYPQHKQEIKELWSLMMSEIEEGGSIHHECELFILDVADLISEEND